jgi:putative ABC transport system substrate-binding protein
MARAQQPAMPVIGFLSPVPAGRNAIVAFLQSLKENGFVEGQNVAIEYRSAEGQPDRLPALAADLVRRRVAVVVAPSVLAALAAKAATTTIPIVFSTGTDPVALGLVARLNRPGGNLTGITGLFDELAPKRLQFLRELIPNAALFGILTDPSFPSTPFIIADLQAAGRNAQLVVMSASTDSDLETAFATFSQRRVGAVMVGPSVIYNRRREQLASLAARHALPTIYPNALFAVAGGLMSYGGNVQDGDWGHQLGIYTARILIGEKPADLPVQQPTKFELVINLKTAKALGLTIPETLLATADEVIQ